MHEGELLCGTLKDKMSRSESHEIRMGEVAEENVVSD